ncbi:hypothetical protein MERGE_001537 [Pneumocystis wakefieldiae]|uniref:CID domain-containing protein n=1 Tax=Pneumocystis wakefieldiae TaxID=38082 RepID=A0A899G795_9ASCO|nr:hypothetical protein MERGE_001537 [Pneumocystis wakefieldiae]
MPLPQEELEEIKQDYLDSLQDLTINSRPLIRDLTIIAQETLYAAQYIVKAVEEHINRAPPSHKLPALYLLDSICKNIGSPYTIYFGQNLSKIFINTYTLMEPHLRMKMEELLQTWKQPVPGTNSLAPVFSQEITRKIDGLLNKIRQLRLQHDQQRKIQASKSTMIPSAPLNSVADYSSGIINLGNISGTPDSIVNQHSLLSMTSNITVNSLLLDISSLLAVAQKRVLLNPDDEIALKQIPALIKLQSILQISRLPADQLSAVKEQLSALSLQQQQNTLQAVHYYPLQSSYIGSSINVPPNTQSTDAETLLASLRSAGLLTDVSKNSTNDLKPYLSMDPSNLTLSSIALLNNSMSAIELKSSSLTKHRPELVVLLYECMSLQCYTCAKRFEDTQDGRKKRDAHLDWHFRINNRLRELSSRGQSRSWYFDEEEWIKYNHEDVSLITVEPLENDLDKPKKNKDFNHDDSYVLTPTDPNAANEPCPICKEKFISVWNEDVEEWVWKNSISIEGVIYHASCLSEASAASQTFSRESASETVIKNGGTSSTVLGKRKAISE